MHAHAPILDVVATTGIRTKGITDSKVDKRPVSHASVHDEEAWMARRRHSLARMRRKRQSRRAGLRNGPGAGWAGAGDDMSEVRDRCTAIEEGAECDDPATLADTSLDSQ